LGWRDRARHAMPSSNDESTPSAEGRSAAGGTQAEVVILGGSDETRLLLRGLLRLHHHRVDREVRTAETLEPRPPGTTPRVLILVADTESDDWSRELVTARDRQPGLLPLLVVPEASPRLVERARAVGVRGILTRPFAVRDLVGAVATLIRGGERFPPPDPEPGRGQR
jgi:AmiR/NasT family two-component response regulator